MRGGNKKALSTIVSTLLILLLVFVAIGLLWVVIRNVIQSGTEQISLGKLTLDLEIENVAISGNTLNVRVKRNPGEGTFTGLSFVVDDGRNSEVIQVKNVTMGEYALQTFSLDLNSVGLTANNIETVEVAPIFTLESGKEVTGDVKSSYALTPSGTTITTNCGNNVIDTGEDCDGSNISSSDTCASVIGNSGATGTLSCTSSCAFDTSACSLPSCPNGIIESGLGEDCDCGTDASCTSTELNSQTCLSYLGTGYSGTLGCSQTSCQFDITGCVYTPTCGDGVNETGEQCDDGDTTSGDGCSSTCTIESGYTCSGGSGQSTCTLIPTASCGDGIIQSSNNEVCDCGTDGTCTSTELGGATCSSLNSSYTGGTLGCYSSTSCQYDFSACTTSGGATPTNWQTGIVSWWNFDTDATDSVGSNDGSVTGATHVTTGCAYGSGCYSFDGDNDYIEVPVAQGSSLDISGTAMSISGMFNVDSVGTAQIFLGKPASSTQHISPYFAYGVHLYSTYYRAYFSTNVSTFNTLFTAAGIAINPGQWYHFVAVYDNGQLCTYLDGSLYGTCASVATGSTIHSYDSPLRIGVNGGFTEDFAGDMDEIIIWNRALNSTEIIDVFNYFP